MSRLYCPFCSSRYQIYKSRSDGVLVCSQCGELLIKKPFLNTKQIFGFLTAFVFLFPLFIMVFYLLKEFTNDKFPNNSESPAIIYNK